MLPRSKSLHCDPKEVSKDNVLQGALTSSTETITAPLRRVTPPSRCATVQTCGSLPLPFRSLPLSPTSYLPPFLYAPYTLPALPNMRSPTCAILSPLALFRPTCHAPLARRVGARRALPSRRAASSRVCRALLLCAPCVLVAARKSVYVACAHRFHTEDKVDSRGART